MKKFLVAVICVLAVIALSPEAHAAKSKGKSKAGKCGYDTVVGYSEANTPAEKSRICSDHADRLIEAALEKACGPQYNKTHKQDAEAEPQKRKDKNCAQVSEDAEAAYKQAARDSDDPARKHEICEKARKDLKSKTRGWDCGSKPKETAEAKPDILTTPSRNNCMTPRGGFSSSYGDCPKDIEPASGAEGQSGPVHQSRPDSKNPLQDMLDKGEATRDPGNGKTKVTPFGYKEDSSWDKNSNYICRDQRCAATCGIGNACGQGRKSNLLVSPEMASKLGRPPSAAVSPDLIKRHGLKVGDEVCVGSSCFVYESVTSNKIRNNVDVYAPNIGVAGNSTRVFGDGFRVTGKNYGRIQHPCVSSGKFLCAGYGRK